MFVNNFKLVSSSVLLSALVACGGGGGGDVTALTGPVTSTLSFPIRAGLNSQVANGITKTLTANGTPATEIVDGRCSGVISRTTGPATGGATFEGAAALSAGTVITLNFSNCTPASNTSTATNYYDSNYLPLGEINQDGSYSLYLVPPTIPNTVKVGAVGIIGTRTLYANSTKAVIVGRLDSSFVIDPDTADTAILRSITKKYDANAQLLYTEQDKYRMTGAGSMSAIAVDIQYANTSTVHLVFK